MMTRSRSHDWRRAFGDRLRSLRHEVGISQEELAFRAGLHRTYVSSVERGERNISLANIHSLADALGIDVRRLFDEEPPETNSNTPAEAMR
jgi:transcriptional regulator with XRE-family HTH domain